MADQEQETQQQETQQQETQQQEKPEGQPQAREPETSGITDSHGQEGISKAKYQREMGEKDALIAKLQRQLQESGGKAKTADEKIAELQANYDKLTRQLADEKVNAALAAAGCVNAKAARAVLDDYDGDVAKLKEDCPYLFAQKKQTGSTGGAPAGAPKADEIAKARAAAGLPPKK